MVLSEGLSRSRHFVADEESWCRAIAEGSHPFPVDLPIDTQLRMARRIRALRTEQLRQFLVRQMALSVDGAR